MFQFTLSYSQKNTEQYRYTKDIGFYNTINAGFELSSGNEEFVKLTGSYRLDFISKNFYTFLVGDIEYKEGNSRIITNKGFLHYRFIHKKLLFLNPEFFTQLEYDDFLLIEHRELFGAGIRIDIANYSNIDSVTNIDFDIGLGIMQEYEKYKISDPDKSDLIRSTNFVSFFLNFNKYSNFNLVIYYQPALNNLDDYRMLGEMKLSLPIFNGFSFYTQLNYRYDNHPLPNLKYYTFGMNNGFSISKLS